MRDLFGVEIADDDAPVAAPTKPKRDYSPRGYARRPGSGPEGETCESCGHRVRMCHGNKTFSKCALMRRCWTHSVKTDIKASSPACEEWQAKAVANGGGVTCDAR